MYTLLIIVTMYGIGGSGVFGAVHEAHFATLESCESAKKTIERGVGNVKLSMVCFVRR
jgi:hypothetical protein